MNNEQNFSDIGNPTINIDTGAGKPMEKQSDPIQLMAFDSMRKINTVMIILVFLVITNLALLTVVSVETVSTRQQYDKLRHTANDLKEQVAVMKQVLENR